ncbi:sensor histidine kinase [Methylococcus sp. EFPC2]|uniref:sensor histidine kinase n=1 Tax=Methylococcus sp. EFPC2 TaxID=2812648 RepID=UPI0019689529|nr:ATP-binding protein [Methylococcus sp. EFPC2]QSA97848.1 PAS domain-containing protein [Methylococcus sp. EFPC2]
MSKPAEAKRFSLAESSKLALAGGLLLLGMALPAAAGPLRTGLMGYGESDLSPARSIFDENLRSTAIESDPLSRRKEPSFWETYRGWIIAIVAVMVVQAVLIAALLVERRRRRQTRAELLESEKRMSLAANAMGVGMWLWDIARDDIWASPQARALYGITESETIDFERFLRSVHPADRKTTRKAVENALADGREFSVQYRVVPHEGEVRWVSVHGQVESVTAGRPGAIAWVSIDVTDRKSAELEAEQHRNELVRMARVGLLGQLSGSLAHELNQPLASILSNAQAAQRLLRQEPVDLEEIRDIFKDIVEEDQRAVEVIRRLRSLFNRGELQRQPLDMSEVAGVVLKLMHSDLLTRHVLLFEELAKGLPAVSADRVQLQQVLLNLIVNACESMAENHPDDRRLMVRTGRGDGGEVMVEVVDAGKGLDSSVADRLFEPFFTTKSCGIGMGLAICRSIIEAHGGWITFTNNADRGATFRVSLPVMESIGR